MNVLSTDNSTVVASAGSNVLYRAGTSITLKPGFHAENGSTFSAMINSCSYVPTASATRAGILSPGDVSGESIYDSEVRFSVHPNPSTGIFDVTHPAKAKVLRVIDLTGKVITEKATEGTQTQVNLQTHSAGLYILMVDGVGVSRLIKQ